MEGEGWKIPHQFSSIIEAISSMKVIYPHHQYLVIPLNLSEFFFHYIRSNMHDLLEIIIKVFVYALSLSYSIEIYTFLPIFHYNKEVPNSREHIEFHSNHKTDHKFLV